MYSPLPVNCIYIERNLCNAISSSNSGSGLNPNDIITKKYVRNSAFPSNDFHTWLGRENYLQITNVTITHTVLQDTLALRMHTVRHTTRTC